MNTPDWAQLAVLFNYYNTKVIGNDKGQYVDIVKTILGTFAVVCQDMATETLEQSHNKATS